MAKAGFSEAFVVAGEYNVTPPTPSSGQAAPLQLDSNGNLLVNIGSSITVSENLASVGGAAISLGAKTSANSIPVVLASDEANVPTLGAISALVSTTITSATSTGTVLSIPCAGYSTVLVDIRALNSCTGGTIQFEGVGPGSFNSSITGMRQIDSNSQQFYDATSTQSLALSNDTRIIYQIPVAGLSTVNVILSPAFTGSGSILLAGRASNGSAPGPTTVGQSDASKLNATTLGAVVPAASTTTWSSSGSPQVVIPCAGYGTVIVNILVDGGTFSGGALTLTGFLADGTSMFMTGMRTNANTGIQFYDAGFGLTFVSGASRYFYVLNCSGYTSVRVSANGPIVGTGTVQISAQVSVGTPDGPTTVGQSDASKLNVTNQASVTTNPPSYTAGTTNPLSLDVNGGLRTVGNTEVLATATWTSATPGATSLIVNCRGMGSLLVAISTTNVAFSAGQIRFLAGSEAFDLSGMRMGSTNFSLPVVQNYDAQNFHNFSNGDLWHYWFNVSGYDTFTIYLGTPIGGSGTATISVRGGTAPCSGPTTVGQSDPTKLNVSLGRAASSSTAGNPAAGTDFNITFGATGLFQTFRARFIASATAANRSMNFLIQDASGNTLYAQQMAFNVTASQGVDYYMGLALPLSAVANAGGQAYIPIPQMVVQSGWKVLVQTTNIQAGDQWSLLGYSLETS